MTIEQQQLFLVKQHLQRQIWKLEDIKAKLSGNEKLKYRNKILALKRRLK